MLADARSRNFGGCYDVGCQESRALRFVRNHACVDYEHCAVRVSQVCCEEEGLTYEALRALLPDLAGRSIDHGRPDEARVTGCGYDFFEYVPRWVRPSHWLQGHYLPGRVGLALHNHIHIQWLPLLVDWDILGRQHCWQGQGCLE
eukprot:scaffold323_cov414-Prasinococcus_capsulatus_cf.AAC.52